MPLIGLAPAKLSTFGDISALLSTPGASQLSAIGLDNNMYVLLNGCAGIPGLQCVGLPGGTLCCACTYIIIILTYIYTTINSPTINSKMNTSLAKPSHEYHLTTHLGVFRCTLIYSNVHLAAYTSEVSYPLDLLQASPEFNYKPELFKWTRFLVLEITCEDSINDGKKTSGPMKNIGLHGTWYLNLSRCDNLILSQEAEFK